MLALEDDIYPLQSTKRHRSLGVCRIFPILLFTVIYVFIFLLSNNTQINILACYLVILAIETWAIYALETETIKRYLQLGIIEVLFLMDATLIVLFSFSFTDFDEIKDFWDCVGLICGLVLIFCQTCTFIR